MTRSLRAALAVALAVLAPMTLAQGAPERGPQSRRAAQADTAMARVIVRIAPGSALTRAQAMSLRGELRHAAPLSRAAGITLADGRSIDERTQVVFASGVDAHALAARLAAVDGVESAVVDRKRYVMAAPNDPYYLAAPSTASGQWYLRAPNAITLSAINAEAAWDITQGSSSVVVADLDTGVRLDHPDLAGKLLPGYDFISADSGGVFTTANDNDGRDGDPNDPGDLASDGSSWHGTQTSGLIGAATNNGIGVAGVGPNVMVLPVRVMGVNGGYDSDIQAGMRWAAGLAVPGVPANTNPAKVLNMSLGAPGDCGAGTGYPAAISAVTAAGAVVVVSAGNDGLAVNEPANCPGVVAVAGVRHTGTKVGYSSLGPQVALAAPAGNCVNLTGPCLYPLVTTSNSGATAPAANIYTDGGSTASLGTSFAAPLVSGTAALMFSANPGLTPAQVITMLKSTTRAFPSSGAGAGVSACLAPSSTAQKAECYCTTSTCGTGMLDTAAAVAAAAAAAGPIATAQINAAASTVAVGGSLTLDGSGSSATGGDTITGYQWALGSGATLASFSGPTDGPSATLLANAAGSVTVTLTVTSSSGKVGTTTRTITITDPAAAGGGGGGGGAFAPAWLLALLGAIGLLLTADRRRA